MHEFLELAVETSKRVRASRRYLVIGEHIRKLAWSALAHDSRAFLTDLPLHFSQETKRHPSADTVICHD